jgi:hypothetical protein
MFENVPFTSSYKDLHLKRHLAYRDLVHFIKFFAPVVSNTLSCCIAFLPFKSHSTPTAPPKPPSFLFYTRMKRSGERLKYSAQPLDHLPTEGVHGGRGGGKFTSIYTQLDHNVELQNKEKNI